MADKPIYGYSTSNPVLMYGSNSPVSMVSPNPNAPWTHVTPTNVYNASVSVTTGEFKITNTGTAEFYAKVLGIYLVYAGLSTVNFTLSASGPSAYFGTVGTYTNGAIAGSAIYLDNTGTLTGTLAVPYYRYRLHCELYGNASAIGSWVKLAITFS